jgi:NAD(P)-dependent dehydrogenase (short-subunit alcohol dehydrogenase family)
MVVQKGSSVTMITGGASGIGRATALRLAKRGDRVALCDLNESGLRETCEMIRAVGGEVISAVVDVRDNLAVTDWCGGVVG